MASTLSANPFNTATEADAPASAADRELYSSQAPAWTHGHAGQPRPLTPATDSGILAILVALLVLVGLNMRHVRRIFSSLPQDLLSVRRRNNAFDEHTANETRVIALLLLGTAVMEGLLLFLWLGRIGPLTTAATVFSTITALIALMVAFYLFQLAACATVGFTFTDRLSASLWRRGLNASTAILGIALTAPAMVALFYPAFRSDMLLAGAALYVLSRLCYIYKGFRIFYDKIPSLLYFILYLCTLEIVPVIAACLLASEICVKAQ